jgi:hypothetical protein
MSKAKKTGSIYLYSLLVIVSYFAIDKYSIDFTFEDYKEYSSVLMNVSSMVFTIMGIWIAFLYPNALSRIVDSKVETVDFSESLQDTKRLQALVGSILKSAFVIIFLMLIYLSKVILFKTPLYTQNIILIKQLVLSFTIVLSYMQFEAVLYVMYSNFMFLNDLHSKREDREADADI